MKQILQHILYELQELRKEQLRIEHEISHLRVTENNREKINN